MAKIPKGKQKISKPTPAPVSNKSKPKPVSRKEQKGWKYWALAGAAVLITILIFYPGLSTLQFVNWDDPDNLLTNTTLKIFSYSWDWPSVKTIFTTGVIGNYNPLPILTFAIEKHLFAPDPLKNAWIFHFDNLWMHAVCTFFVFVILKQMKLSDTAAFIGALLFGIHPMRVESVAWVTERKDVLYGMFFLASLSCYIAFTKTNSSKIKWYILAIVLSVFSYFAKVQAVTLPLTMVAMDFYFRRKWYAPKILIIEKLPWWLMSLAMGLVNVYFLGANKSINFENKIITYNFIDRLAVGAYAYATYVIKWIYPFMMSPLYPYPKHLPPQAYISLAVVPIVLIALAIWAWKKGKRNILFAVAFFTLNVMFLLQIVGAGQGYLADRFTYIAYIGLFFLVAKGYEALVQFKPAYKTIASGAIVVYFALFGFMTVQQIKIWQDGGTMWEQIKKYYPNSPLAWKQAGNYYRDEKKDFAKALENFKQAIALQPTDAYVYNSVAKIYVDNSFALDPQMQDYKFKHDQMIQEAIRNYNSALRQDSIDGRPNHKQTGEVMINRGAAYGMLGNIDQAITDLSRGLEFDPLNSNGYLNRGLIYFQQNKMELSLKDHDSYVSIDPFNADIIYERGLIKTALGKPEEAMPDLDKAIILKNTQPLFFIGRARAEKMLGRKDAMAADLKVAQQMGAQIPADLQ